MKSFDSNSPFQLRRAYLSCYLSLVKSLSILASLPGPNLLTSKTLLLQSARMGQGFHVMDIHLFVFWIGAVKWHCFNTRLGKLTGTTTSVLASAGRRVLSGNLGRWSSVRFGKGSVGKAQFCFPESTNMTCWKETCPIPENVSGRMDFQESLKSFCKRQEPDNDSMPAQWSGFSWRMRRLREGDLTPDVAGPSAWSTRTYCQIQTNSCEKEERWWLRSRNELAGVAIHLGPSNFTYLAPHSLSKAMKKRQGHDRTVCLNWLARFLDDRSLVRMSEHPHCCLCGTEHHERKLNGLWTK